ncbi:MAG: hypothetical protein V2I33_22965 [Kangiellaceae bacterium]|jgi:hypothetical protein|nr:hypothetical protein [Kangiellaceae bacterium]
MRVFFATVIAVSAYLAYLYLTIMDYWTSQETHDDDGCFRVPTGYPGSEDVMWLDSEHAIFSSCDLVKLEDSNFTIPFGKIMMVDIRGNLRELERHGFPAKVAFYPHGLSIWEGRWLYVINHAFNRGGERVEVFEIRRETGIELHYQQSLVFPDRMAGALNDLVVIGPG